MTASDILSIVSIVLGVVSIVLSIWIYFKSSELSNKTNETLIKIDDSTKRLTDLYDNYVKEIFELFKNTHNRMTDKQFGEPTGGSEIKKEDAENGK